MVCASVCVGTWEQANNDSRPSQPDKSHNNTHIVNRDEKNEKETIWHVVAS